MKKLLKDIQEAFPVKLIGSILSAGTIILLVYIEFPSQVHASIYFLFHKMQNEALTLFLIGTSLSSVSYIVNSKALDKRLKTTCGVVLVFGLFFVLFGSIGLSKWINLNSRLDEYPTVAYIGANPGSDPVAGELNRFVDSLNNTIDRNSPTIQFMPITVRNQPDGLLSELKRSKRAEYDIVILNGYNPFDLTDREEAIQSLNPRTIYLTIGPHLASLLPRNRSGDILPNVISLSPPLLDEIVWMVQALPFNSPVNIVYRKDGLGQWSLDVAKRLLQARGISVKAEISVDRNDSALYQDNEVVLWLDWRGVPPDWLNSNNTVVTASGIIREFRESYDETGSPRVIPFLGAPTTLNDPLLNNIVVAAKSIIRERFAGSNPRSLDVRTNIRGATRSLRKQHTAYLSLDQRLVHRPLIDSSR